MIKAVQSLILCRRIGQFLWLVRKCHLRIPENLYLRRPRLDEVALSNQITRLPLLIPSLSEQYKQTIDQERTQPSILDRHFLNLFDRKSDLAVFMTTGMPQSIPKCPISLGFTHDNKVLRKLQHIQTCIVVHTIYPSKTPPVGHIDQ